MLTVLAALVPGAAAQLWYFGAGVLGNLLLALLLGLAVEAACLRLLGRPLQPTVSNATTPLTVVLLALALPPGVAPGVLALAVVTAVGLGKYLYGGLGQNPFNPAMVGYVLVLVSFPLALAQWPSPVEAVSGATPLTAFKYREGQTVGAFWNSANGFGALGGAGWEWINGGFLLGGLVLAARGLLAWRIPAAMLTTLAVLAALGYDAGSSASLGSPAYHLFTGATMLGAFFIATDPVTHPATARGQLVFGALVGALTFVIRSFGNYPDGVAFAVLLGNACTPWLDRRLVPAHD